VSVNRTPKGLAPFEGNALSLALVLLLRGLAGLLGTGVEAFVGVPTLETAREV
jgi:hypothetical protein